MVLIMSKNVEILNATMADAQRIAELSYQVGKMHDDAMPRYFRPTSKESHLAITKEMISDERVEVFKAVLDKEICGFLFLFVPNKSREGFVYPITGCIYNLGVEEGCRGKGIGTKLMQKAEAFLRDNEIYAIELSVYNFNKQARRFYEKLGYEEIEVNLHKVLK